ncbi:MAG TPA: DUF1214 domain-containing protein [Stellaceae bacterium]|nr:DUF1214 domain-containing protein [Stellaceae bacterium]
MKTMIMASCALAATAAGTLSVNAQTDSHGWLNNESLQTRYGTFEFSYSKPKMNADGSIDIVFSPNEPKDGGNWIKTVPGRGWFAMFRFYSPTEAHFAKTWALNDIEALQ